MRLIALVAVSGLLLGAAQDKQKSVKLGKLVPKWSLKTPDGKKEIKIEEFRKNEKEKNAGKPVVVVFWSYKCPSGRRALRDIAEFAKFCDKKKVEFLGVCSYGESPKDLTKYCKGRDIKYTLLYDYRCRVADIFQAQVVTTSFLIDKEGKLVYQGAFKSRRKFPLKTALEEVLAGREVSTKRTRPRG